MREPKSQIRRPFQGGDGGELCSGARADDPWLHIIPCQHGHIYPYGDDMLVASTAKRGRVARALSELECTTVWRDGDDGMDLLFHVDDFEQVVRGGRE